MGSVFKQKVTRRLPKGAEIVEQDGKRWAEWKDRRTGKMRQAPLNGQNAKRLGIVVTTKTFYAKYRDGDGIVRTESTGCKSRERALRVLADLESRAEKVRSGVLSSRDLEVADHQHTPLSEHIEDYLDYLAKKPGKGGRQRTSAAHLDNVRRGLIEITRACRFKTLRDLDRDAVIDWARRTLLSGVLGKGSRAAGKADKDGDGPGKTPAPRTINSKLIAITAFGNWLIDQGRLNKNPFARLKKLDESDDIRRNRRALTAEEYTRLLRVARCRPLAEMGRQTVRLPPGERKPKSRATWRKLPLTLDTIEAATEKARRVSQADVVDLKEAEGWERALVYEAMLTTGLRKGELASLTVADLDLEATPPVVNIRAGNAKNGRRAKIPLRPDVADHLREWLAAKRERAARSGGRLSATDRLFYVPKGLIRIFDRDLEVAGIPKIDERGRQLDVHAMRTTFNSQLAAAGVDPRTSMAAMRVSSLDLVLKTYADESLLDVSGAVNLLPAPPAPNAKLDAVSSPAAPVCVTPNVTPTSGMEGSSGDSGGTLSPRGQKVVRSEKARITRENAVIPAKEEKRAKGLEPSTSSLGS